METKHFINRQNKMFLFFNYLFFFNLLAAAKYQTFLINLEKRSDKLKTSEFQLNYLNISFNLFK